MSRNNYTFSEATPENLSVAKMGDDEAGRRKIKLNPPLATSSYTLGLEK